MRFSLHRRADEMYRAKPPVRKAARKSFKNENFNRTRLAGVPPRSAIRFGARKVWFKSMIIYASLLRQNVRDILYLRFLKSAWRYFRSADTDGCVSRPIFDAMQREQTVYQILRRNHSERREMRVTLGQSVDRFVFGFALFLFDLFISSEDLL